MRHTFYVGCILLLCGGHFSAAAQSKTPPPPKDTAAPSFFIIDASDRLRFQKLDSVTDLNIVVGHVIMHQGTTKFYCDSAVVNNHQKIMQAFGNVHINDNDSVQTYSQYLIYHTDTKIAELSKAVTMTDGKGTLTTEALQYDSKTKTGTYTTGGKIVNGKTVITSKEATYYSELKDVYFKKDVKMKDPAYDLYADSLLYNTDTQVATFITKTHIIDSTGANIVTSDGNYNMKTKKANFGKHSIVKDGKGVTVTGDDIYTDDSITIIRGHGVYVDSAQKVSVLANYMIADKRTNTFLATQHPLMIIEQDKDSIYVASDTMFSARAVDLRDSNYRDLPKDTLSSTVVINPKDSADLRFFQCYHHVRIFSDSLQAVCDSLFYTARDSVFRLYTNPIVWANKSQVTGDTIFLYTKNKKADRMYVFYDGMAINLSDSGQYNQMSGRTINAYFVDGNIDHMRAKGSAQSVYYAKDEHDAMIGVNNATADIIDMKYDDRKLHQVIYRSDVQGTMYPLSQLPEEKKTLRNFKWMDDKRPKTKYELFEDPKQKD
ncbi:MAG TPA: OstA-like protein [Chitinophagaceae bacterium]|jgi:lipopolysaccharide export system protein LptA